MKPKEKLVKKTNSHKILSIGCKHLKTSKTAILVDQRKSEDKRDSGKLYVCEVCYKKGLNEVNWDIENWITICEDCINQKLIDYN